MKFRFITFCLAVSGLLYSLSVVADTEVNTESLRLKFGDQGDLLRVEACFPTCSGGSAKIRVLSADQGMLVFEGLCVSL